MKKIIHTSAYFVKYNLCILGLGLSLCACGQKTDPLVESYRTDMDAFCTRIETISAGIDTIDPAAEDSDTVLLASLDELDAAFSDMAALEVPESYAEAGTLADQADTLMSDAVELYHEVYENDPYDETKAKQAYMQYSNAMKKLSAIGDYFMSAD